MEQYDNAVSAILLAAQTILECGGETYRAEETALHMGRGFGFEKVEILAFPTGFFITLWLPDGSSKSYTRRIHDRNLYLGDVNDVNSVSRLVSQRKMDAAQALERLEEIHNKPRMKPLHTLLAFAFCCAFFTLMFNGDLKDMCISFVAGLAMRYMMPIYRSFRIPSPLVSMFSGMINAGVTILLISLIGGNQDAIIAGALMPLLPGLAFTNAVRDTMRGDLISGIGRLADATINILLLGYGVAFVVSL
jgi:uncharacterized membrane protein YjjP (DUF1212 family)